MRLFITLILITLGSQAVAASFKCDVKKNGYAHSLNAAAGNLPKQLEIAKSWIPEQFTITPTSLSFKGWRSLDVIGGDREKSFSVRGTENDIYRVNMNTYNGTGTVNLEKPDFKPMGPVRYTCQNSTSSSRTPNTVRSKFNSLSSCNRKYIQNFLKTAGLYNSSIDGQWGPGTAKAIRGASNLSKLRGLSSEAIIRKLSDNLICD